MHGVPRPPLRLLFWLILVISLMPLTLQAENPDPEWIYLSRPGEHLDVIGQRYLKPERHWSDLIQYNALKEPYLLKPGTPIRIPVSWLNQGPAAATLLRASRSPLIRRAHTQAWIETAVPSNLLVGDEVKTAEAEVTLRFADGSEVDLAPGTHIILNRMTRYGATGMMDTRFKLIEGSIENRVTPIREPAGRYEVTTPGAVAAVRGTEFRLTADNQVTRAEVTEGRVELKSAKGAVTLEAGQGFQVGRGDGLIESLPEAPVLPADSLFEILPVSITWTEVKAVSQYRWRLSAADSGATLIDGQTSKPRLAFTSLSNGDYRLTVRSVGENGMESDDAVAAFKVKQNAPPAELQSPADGTVHPEQSLKFQWQTQSAAVLSSLEISHSADFASLVTRTGFAAVNETRPEVPLRPGIYYWRVVTLAGGDTFAYTPARMIKISGTLDETRIIAVNYALNRAKVYWRQVAGASAYELQIAEDEFFSRITSTLRLLEPSATLDLSPDKSWYVRVRALGDELTTSGFGPYETVRIENARQ